MRNALVLQRRHEPLGNLAAQRAQAQRVGGGDHEGEGGRIQPVQGGAGRQFADQTLVGQRHIAVCVIPAQRLDHVAEIIAAAQVHRDRGGGGIGRALQQYRVQVFAEARAVGQAGGAIAVGTAAQVFDPQHGQVAQAFQLDALLRIQPGTRVGANHAQRADGVAIAQLERCASVKADMRRTQYQRVVAEARVQQGIGNHQDVIGAQRVRAEGMFARGLRRFQADTGFEPLAVLVHQRDQGDLGPQHACGHGGDGVEHRVGRRVQQAKTVQDRQPCRFIERRREGGGDRSGRGMHVPVSASSAAT